MDPTQGLILAPEKAPSSEVLSRKLSDLMTPYRGLDRLTYDDIIYVGDLVQRDAAEIFKSTPWDRFLATRTRTPALS